MSVEEVAAAFIGHFYGQVSSQNWNGLVGLYQPTSTTTFEGAKLTGPQEIVTKYSTLRLRYDQIKHDVQMSINSNALLIFVYGHVYVDDSTNPLQFSHVFQLVATGPGQYYVHNEIFRLIYA